MDRAQALALLAALLAAGCGRNPDTVVVGSKNFTEQAILGEIVAQHLERRGRKVDRKLNLGGTLLAHRALVSGEIDVYPEYTGTALMEVLKLPAAYDPDEVRRRVASEYKSRWGLEWLPPLGFSNTFAMVIEGGAYETLSEAARRGRGWKLGVGYEFLTRPDGLPGLVERYGLPLDGNPRSMDLGLLYQALKQKQVEMVAGNSTDGLIGALGLKMLRDDRSYFPPYDAALVARAELREALAPLSGRIDTGRMRKLNYQVDGERRRIPDVAREFLDGL
jgi:glycine betaine/choline ABC-type transport system substrate-binding protein